MKKILNKIIISFLLVFVFLISATFLPQTIFAQSEEEIYNLLNHKWYSEQDPLAWYAKVYDENVSPESEIFGERYTAAQVQWILYSLFSQIWNWIPGNPDMTNCMIANRGTVCWDLFIKAFDLINPLADNTKTITPLAFEPNTISGIGYVKNLIAKFNPIKETNAQGFGYTSGAKPVVKLWEISRNISYSLIFMALIVMSFMIMFKMKISPQTIITVQQAIPNLIITIVLVTFSYAIAGFAIDLMYVVIGFIAGAISSGGLTSHNPAELFNALTNLWSPFVLMYYYWLALVATSFSTIMANSTSFILGILLFLFFVIAIFAVMLWSILIIKVILINWANILLTIALGPLSISVGTFTGKSSFWGWLKKLISHLAVYPVMGLMFFFSFFFLVQGSDYSFVSLFSGLLYGKPTPNIITDNTWLPPFSGFALGDNLVWLVVSFTIFSNITKVTNIVQSLLAGKPFEFGSAVEELAKKTWDDTAGAELEAYKKYKMEDRVRGGRDIISGGERRLRQMLGLPVTPKNSNPDIRND